MHNLMKVELSQQMHKPKCINLYRAHPTDFRNALTYVDLTQQISELHKLIWS